MQKTKRLYLNVYNSCNLNCIHCFNHGGKAGGDLLSTVEIASLVEQARKNTGIVEVRLGGGEPTERPDLFRLLGSLLEQDVRIVLQSNAAFNEDIRSQLMNMYSDKLSLIVSLDGLETNDALRGPGVTDKVISNLEILSRKFSIRINTLLTSGIKQNEIFRIVQLAKKLGLSLAFNPLCPTGRADRSFLMAPDAYFEWMKRIEEFRGQGLQIRKGFNMKNGRLAETENCPVRKGSAIFIDSNGAVFPCGFLAGQPSFRLGSIREVSLVELLQRTPPECRVVPEKCRACELYLKGHCFAGCPARIFWLYGNFDAPDIYCLNG